MKTKYYATTNGMQTWKGLNAQNILAAKKESTRKYHIYRGEEVFLRQRIGDENYPVAMREKDGTWTMWAEVAEEKY